MLPIRKLGAAACLAAILMTITCSGQATAEPAALTNTEVSFQSDTLTLHGTVVAPAGPGTGRTGLVLVAGAGPRPRDSYRKEAEAFAAAGIVVLIYDKRSDYSRMTSSFDKLADDAIAGVRLLRGRPDVEPSRVGVWGHSEGGWVVPLAAAKSTDIAFVIPVGASALRADRTQLWSNRTYLARAGVSASRVEQIGVNTSRMLIDAGLFGDLAHDPVATLRRVRQPLLAAFGEFDRSVAPGESLRLYQQALDQGGNRHYTLRVVRGANHNLRQTTDGYRDTRSGEFALGYVDLITSWISRLPSGPPAASADQPPAQDITSTPTEPLAWYEQPWLQLTLVAVMLLGFFGYPVCAAVRRLRGRRERLPARWPARSLAGLGAVTVLGTVTFLFSVVMTGATSVDVTVLGRPPLWLLLQLLAVGVIAAGTVTAIRWRRADGGQLQRGLLAAGALTFLPWALYWGLLTP